MSDESSGENFPRARSAEQCLTDDEVEAYAAGRLVVDQESVEEHLLICHQCLDRVEEEEQLIADVRLAGTAAPLGPKSERRIPWWWFVPAGAVALVLVSLLPGRLRLGAGEQVVELSAVRSNESQGVSVTAEAGELVLSANVADLPSRSSYVGVVVNERADVVVEGNPERKGDMLRWPLGRRLPRGSYWVQLYSPDNRTELLREYGLEVR
jgi:hypothetical protein